MIKVTITRTFTFDDEDALKIKNLYKEACENPDDDEDYNNIEDFIFMNFENLIDPCSTVDLYPDENEEYEIDCE